MTTCWHFCAWWWTTKIQREREGPSDLWDDGRPRAPSDIQNGFVLTWQLCENSQCCNPHRSWEPLVYFRHDFSDSAGYLWPVSYLQFPGSIPCSIPLHRGVAMTPCWLYHLWRWNVRESIPTLIAESAPYLHNDGIRTEQGPRWEPWPLK